MSARRPRGPRPENRAPRSTADRTPGPVVLVLLGLCFLALAPAIFLGNVPAQTDWLPGYGPWGSAPWVPDSTNVHNLGGGDNFFVYLPDRLSALNEWRNGRVPLWNPYVSGGVPFLGMQTAQPLDPLIVLELVLPTGRALGLAYAILLFLAGLGVVLYLKDHGLIRPGALAVAAIAFAFNPYFVAWLENRIFVAGLATLPLALWAMERVVRGDSRPPDIVPGGASTTAGPAWTHAAILSLAVGYAALGGTLQTFALFLLIVLVRLTWVFLAREPVAPVPPTRSPGLTIGAALALGLAIGILPLVAGVELLCHSTRLGAGGYYSGSNFLHWRAVALWFNQGVFGFPNESEFLVLKDFGRRFMSGSGWGYAGVVPLGLAVLALIRRSGPRSERLFWGGIAGLTLTFLLLQATPLHQALVGLLPWLTDVDLLRGLIVVNLGVAVLAGWGANELATLWEGASDRRQWILPWAAYLAIGGGALFAGRFGIATNHSLGKDFLPFLLPGLLVVAIGLLPLRPRLNQFRSWPLAVIVAAELLGLHFVVNGFADPKFTYPEHLLTDSLKDLMSGKGSRYMVAGRLRMLPPNTGSVHGLSDVRGYSNISIARYRLILESAEGRRDLKNLPALTNVDSQVYRLLAAEYLFAIEPFDSPHYERAAKKILHRRRDSLPRAFMVHDVLTVPGEREMRQALSHPLFDPESGMILEAAAGPPPPVAPPKGPEAVRIVSVEPNDVVIEALTTAAGILILSDPFYPGWQAFIDGKKAPILPAYWGLKGVALPEGRHDVVFRYRPWWLVPAAVVTAAAILVVAVAFLPAGKLGRRFRRESKAAPEV